MSFVVIVNDPAHLPWAVPVEGGDVLTAIAEVTKMEGLIQPIMVVDYSESKVWRVGLDESGWYLSDSATVKMGVMTQPEHIARDVTPVKIFEENQQGVKA